MDHEIAKPHSDLQVGVPKFQSGSSLVPCHALFAIKFIRTINDNITIDCVHRISAVIGRTTILGEIEFPIIPPSAINQHHVSHGFSKKRQ